MRVRVQYNNARTYTVAKTETHVECHSSTGGYIQRGFADH